MFSLLVGTLHGLAFLLWSITPTLTSVEVLALTFNDVCYGVQQLGPHKAVGPASFGTPQIKKMDVE